MQTQTLQAAYGCLLHDFGKIVYRAGGQSGTHSHLGWEALRRVLTDPAWKPSLDCLRWHHASELRRDAPPREHPAYLVCAADNLSAGADRREQVEAGGRFIRDLPLSSIFTHLNGGCPGFSVEPLPMDGRLRMPKAGAPGIAPGRYADAQREIENGLRGTQPEADRLNSLLVLLESWASNFPSSTFTGESPDISLYDHLKTTAAIGCCISEYLLEQGETDLKGRLFDHEADFRKEPCFLLYTADLSGIQKFLYTVAQNKALRSLRSRSFFLGLMMEHYIDELLLGCGLSRANLLYSGGGHCYLLLPNTQKVKSVLTQWNKRFNDFLLQEFGISLFLGHGWAVCCGNDLINVPKEQTPYREMFRRASAAVAAHKLHRYDPEQILRMNQGEPDSARECRVCGRHDVLEDQLCPWCQCFVRLSDKIQKSDVYVVSTSSSFTPDLTLPTLDGQAGFLLTDLERARKLLDSDSGIRRIYTKNKSYTGLRYSTRLYVGDYTASNQMEQLADQAQGIRRIGVSRMDVDNLGFAFVQGFENPGDPQMRYHYVTLSRTAALSRQLSLFFQLYINELLSGAYGNQRPLAVSVVYSGGDDVFLVGAWNDVLEASSRIQAALAQYTCTRLTISGGIGLYDEHFPIRAAADRTAELEECAKQLPGKNGISLFDPSGQHTYGWETFRQKVLGEKLQGLREFMHNFPELGNSFLYKMLQLLRQSQQADGRINLARYAYQLARIEPKRNDPRWKCYHKFADDMYQWAFQPEDLGQLITAIYLYVYENRGTTDV